MMMVMICLDVMSILPTSWSDDGWECYCRCISNINCYNNNIQSQCERKLLFQRISQSHSKKNNREMERAVFICEIYHMLNMSCSNRTFQKWRNWHGWRRFTWFTVSTSLFLSSSFLTLSFFSLFAVSPQISL